MSPRSEEFIAAATPSAEETKRYVEGAADFLAAVEEMLTAPGGSEA